MASRAFRSQLLVSALAVVGGVLAESVVGALPAKGGSWLAAGQALLFGLGLWAGLGALLVVLLAALLAASCADAPLGFVLREQWRQPRSRVALELAPPLSALLLAWVYCCASAASALHNRELAAALVALAALFGVLALLFGGWLTGRWVLARRSAGLPTLLMPFGLALAALLSAWLLWQTRGGLQQLDPRLWAAPGAALLGFLLADGSGRVRSAGRRPLLVIAAGALVSWGAFFLAAPASAARLAAQGGWSPRLIAALQRLSDFDRDGYSGFLGGGDCAPFDASISPGAREISGDGIDNNCVAGDAGKLAQPQRPRWGAAAHGAINNLNVVVVTIETLRHDHASFVAAARDTTPELKALGRESLVFERMYSSAPLTRLAIASLFSSYAPSEIDWLTQAPEKRMRRIGPQTPWLPELLSARGYDTTAILTDFSAFTPREDAGFERGFRRYDISTKLDYRGGTMWGFPAAEQIDKAISYLEQAPRPFLLWLHLFEPHYAYEQPPDAPLFGRDEQARYDAEIWQVDHELGRLVRALRRLELWDTTVMLVTGDHGEAFGEHRDRWHGSNLFDPQLRPAALLRVPGVQGKRITQAVTFTDMAPTLTRILGDRQSFDRLRGRSLTPLLHHARLPPEDPDSFVAESFSVDDGHAYQAALVKFPLKLVYVETGQKFTLFDLVADPAEQVPLEPRLDPRAGPLLRELTGYLERARSSGQPAQPH